MIGEKWMVTLFVFVTITHDGSTAPPGGSKNETESHKLPKDDVIIRKIESNGGLGYPASLWPLPPYLSVNRETYPTDPLMKVFNPEYKNLMPTTIKPTLKLKTMKDAKNSKHDGRKTVCQYYRLFALSILRCDYPEKLPPMMPF